VLKRLNHYTRLGLDAEWLENESVGIIIGLAMDVFHVSNATCVAMKEDRFGKTALFQLCQHVLILTYFLALIAWYFKFLCLFLFGMISRESGSRSRDSFSFSYSLQNLRC
jgi:SNF family Na+-dependent transporter